MSLKNRLFAGIFVVSAFAVAGSAQETKEVPKEGAVKAERKARGVEGREMRGKGRHGDRMGHGIRGIDLTDAQREQIKKIREGNKPDAAVFEEMKTIMTARRAGTATTEQEARLQTLKAQRKEKAQAVRAQIQAVLTPEQKAQIEQRKQEMKQRMQERRQQRQTERTKPTPPVVKKDS